MARATGRRGAAAAILLAALAVCAPAAPAAELIDRVLAVVAGQVLTLSDARAVLEFQFLQPRQNADPIGEALDYLVNRQLMLSEVDRYSAPSPDPVLLQKRLAAVRARFPSDAAYNRALLRNALTEARLRDLVGDNIRIENYLDQRFSASAQPTPEEVERYYLDHPAEFTRNGRLLPLDDVAEEAFAKVTTERRNSLIADWLDRVRRRFPITTLYTPARR